MAIGKNLIGKPIGKTKRELNGKDFVIKIYQ